MSTDYTKFKTPFYDIEVSAANSSTWIKLPNNLRRLASKVEITDAFHTADSSDGTAMVLNFVEGFNDKFGNSTGFITDLIFDGKQGIGIFNSDWKKKNNSAPKFLFQERNKIKVTWGYLEDIENSRSFSAYITTVQTTFNETGLPNTVITCLPYPPKDQLAPKGGVEFNEAVRIKTKTGDSVLTFQDMKTDVVIRKIADSLGMAKIISKNMIHDTVDKDKYKMWIAGQSLHEFLSKLAERSNCIYSIRHNPENNKDTIVFMKKDEFEKRLRLPNKELLHWKNPGSILKDINFTAAFDGLVGNAQKGIDNNGKPIENNSMVTHRLYTQYKNSTDGAPLQVIDSDPTGENNPVPSAIKSKDLATKGIVGTVDVTPVKNQQNLTDRSDSKADTQTNLVSLNFTTVGYTKLVPGIVEVNGIGTRYSGKYRILSVVHTIDSNGYVTKCSATSQSVAVGGVKPVESPKGQESDELVKRQVFKPQESADTLDELDKLQGIK
jgi:hypothetical protein